MKRKRERKGVVVCIHVLGGGGVVFSRNHAVFRQRKKMADSPEMALADLVTFQDSGGTKMESN
jgi:hypothetical protein